MEKSQRGMAVRSLSNIPRYADGGVVHPFTVRGVINRAKSYFNSEPETMTQKFARQDAERAAKIPPVTAQATTPEKPNVIDTINARNKLLQGLKDGGEVQPGIIRGKGTGTSDSIKGKMQPGSFVMPKDSTDVMVSNGETNFTPEMVQKIGTAALMMAKGLTHTPVAKQKPDNYFDDGGVVGEKKKNSFGDAAAASQSSAVSQIPTSGYSPAPVGQRVDNTELSRNVSNVLSAIPGAGPAAGAANALLSASRVSQFAGAGAVGAVNAAQKLAPVAVPAGGFYGISQASRPQAPQTAPQIATNNVATQAANTPTTAINVATPAAPAQPEAATVPNNQVTRTGNSYTGAPNITGDISINGRPAIGQQIYPAAQVLSERYQSPSRESMPQERGGVNLGDGSGNVGLGYAANLARKNAETGASSIFNSASRQTARDALKRMDTQDLAGINNQSGQQIAKLNADTTLSNARIGADTQRVGYGVQSQNNLANQQNAAARLGLDTQNSRLSNQATQQKISAGQQLQDLQSKLLTAKPEERAGIEANLRALQGEYAKPVQDEYSHYTKETIDGKSGVIYSKLTGQTVGQQPQQKTAFEAGKIYTDAKGNRATWNGQSFVPVK